MKLEVGDLIHVWCYRDLGYYFIINIVGSSANRHYIIDRRLSNFVGGKDWIIIPQHWIDEKQSFSRFTFRAIKCSE